MAICLPCDRLWLHTLAAEYHFGFLAVTFSFSDMVVYRDPCFLIKILSKFPFFDLGFDLVLSIAVSILS